MTSAGSTFGGQVLKSGKWSWYPRRERNVQMTKQRKSKQALQYMIAQALRDEGHKDVIVRVYPAPSDGNWDAEVIEGHAAIKSAVAALIKNLRMQYDLEQTD
jgi:hypothetical protein